MIAIKAMSKSQLADAYGINSRTLRKWVRALPDTLRERVPLTRAILTPILVADLFKHWGGPE
jgi:transposase-like protein